jgi:toxin-antitoxin system PIN domain toxin
MLLALFDADHVHHPAATKWRNEHRNEGWASCAITQNGFARIMSRSGGSPTVKLASALAALRAQVDDDEHEFWPDRISITDTSFFNHERILGPSQITDVYLLGLAVQNDGRLVTFDRTIPLPGVRDAERRHLIVL